MHLKKTLWSARLLALALMLFSSAAQASDHPPLTGYAIQNWRTDEGLPQSSITAIVQTPDGYLWLGTFQGLARFDGVRFTIFDASNTPELRNSRILRLFVSRDGALWIQSEYGHITRYYSGAFQSFNAPTSLAREEGKASAKLLPPAGCQIVGEDQSGRFWVDGRTTDCYYYFEKGVPQPAPEYSLAPKTMARLRDGTTETFWDGHGGQIYWLTSTNGGSLQVGGTEQGHTNWSVASEALTKISDDKVESRLTPGLGTLYQATFWCDGPQHLWLAPFGGGLYRVLTNGLFQVRLVDPRTPLTVRCLFEDSENNMWVGTEGAGLFRLKPNVFKTYGTAQGVHTPFVKSIVEDRSGTIHIASGHQLSSLDPITDQITNHPSLRIGEVWCAIADARGTIWAGSYGGGLFRCDDLRVRPVPFVGGPAGGVIHAVFEDLRGGLWAGGDALLAVKDGHAEVLRSPWKPSTVRAITGDKQARIYFGLTDGTLLRMAGTNWMRWAHSKEFDLNSITALFYDEHHDAVWIGSFEAGLVRLQSDKFFVFPERAALPRDVLSIIEDDEGNFWLGSSQGLYRVKLDELHAFADGKTEDFESIHYTRTEGLGSTECAGGFQPASLKGHDGRLWFATVNGASVVDPKTMASNRRPPPVIIEKVLADGQPVGQGESEGVLASTEVKIPAGTRRVEIHYTALSYTAPERVRFKYRLEGLDPDWTEVANRREAYLQGLPPGSYAFRVKGCNNDGVWNERGATVRLVVLPFYWQSWWFKCALILAGGAVFSGVVRYIAVRKIRRKLELLEQQHALDKERSRIAKDMHDDLGASLTRISMLGELAEEQLGTSQEAAGSIRRMIDTSRNVVRSMDEILWALNPKNDTLENLVSFISDFAREHLELAGIQCRLDFPLNLPPRPLTSEMRHNLLLVIKESLNNSIKHSGASEVTIRLQILGDGTLDLSIVDNGCGFSEKNSKAGADGLANMPLRVRSLGGEWLLTTQPGQGTAIRIRLPAINP